MSVFPEVVEAIGGKLGAEGRVLDVPVAEVELDGPGVLAVVGQLEAGGMSQHMRVDRHAQPGCLAGAGDQLRIGTRLLKLRRTSAVLGHGLFRRETCAATAEVVCVLFDLATHRPTVIAPDLRRFLEALA